MSQWDRQLFSARPQSVSHKTGTDSHTWAWPRSLPPGTLPSAGSLKISTRELSSIQTGTVPDVANIAPPAHGTRMDGRRKVPFHIIARGSTRSAFRICAFPRVQGLAPTLETLRLTAYMPSSMLGVQRRRESWHLTGRLLSVMIVTYSTLRFRGSHDTTRTHTRPADTGAVARDGPAAVSSTGISDNQR